MPRPIWTGAISFGLVNVPVKLVTAVRKKDVRFNQLHALDGARIQQRRVCSEEDTEVPFEEVAKGYEVSPGRYVMINPEELESLDPKATHTIDIEAFVPLEQIDPLYFDSSYYLVPDDRAEKPYRLLADAMATANQVGIARFVMRNREYLCALRSIGDALVVSTMNFVDEVADVSELEGLPGRDVAVNERELAMARQLIESLSVSFDPERYHDTYREKVLDLIGRKAAGAEIAVGEEPEPVARVIDLGAALEASLRAVEKATGQRSREASEAREA